MLLFRLSCVVAVLAILVDANAAVAQPRGGVSRPTAAVRSAEAQRLVRQRLEARDQRAYRTTAQPLAPNNRLLRNLIAVEARVDRPGATKARRVLDHLLGRDGARRLLVEQHQSRPPTIVAEQSRSPGAAVRRIARRFQLAEFARYVVGRPRGRMNLGLFLVGDISSRVATVGLLGLGVMDGFRLTTGAIAMGLVWVVGNLMQVKSAATVFGARTTFRAVRAEAMLETQRWMRHQPSQHQPSILEAYQHYGRQFGDVPPLPFDEFVRRLELPPPTLDSTGWFRRTFRR